jgi:hypothetical protein
MDNHIAAAWAPRPHSHACLITLSSPVSPTDDDRALAGSLTTLLSIAMGLFLLCCRTRYLALGNLRGLEACSSS